VGERKVVIEIVRLIEECGKAVRVWPESREILKNELLVALRAQWGEPVVMDATLAASRAPRPIPRMRIEVNREREAVTLILEPHVAVHKSPVLLKSIQASLDLHPAVRLRPWCV